MMLGSSIMASYVIAVADQPTSTGDVLLEQALVDLAEQSDGKMVYDRSSKALIVTEELAVTGRVVESDVENGRRLIKRFVLDWKSWND